MNDEFDEPIGPERPWIWGQPEDYVNMRMLIDAAEHGRDHEGLARVREYVDALERIGEMRTTARSTLPIAPFSIAETLPAFHGPRGGISILTPGADFSPDARQIKERHDAVVALFQSFNKFQWSKRLQAVDRGDLEALQSILTATLAKYPAPAEESKP